MRLGLISDIHANLPALEAVLAALRQEGVNGFVCAGDLVGYGPEPDACIEAVAELRAPTVAGNHDLIALGQLSEEQCIPLARNSLRWTRERLGLESRARLAALPRHLSPGDLKIRGLWLAHGSWDDPQEYVTQPAAAAAQLARIREEGSGRDLLVLGHTHRQALRGPDGEPVPIRSGREIPLPEGPALINPGSVGQSRERDPRARAAVLDLSRRTLTFLAVPYDHRRCRELLRRKGLPERSCHLAPHPLSACLWPLRLARRAARQLLARSS